jgi:hypothetical protein
MEKEGRGRRGKEKKKRGGGGKKGIEEWVGMQNVGLLIGDDPRGVVEERVERVLGRGDDADGRGVGLARDDHGEGRPRGAGKDGKGDAEKEHGDKRREGGEPEDEERRQGQRRAERRDRGRVLLGVVHGQAEHRAAHEGAEDEQRGVRACLRDGQAVVLGELLRSNRGEGEEPRVEEDDHRKQRPVRGVERPNRRPEPQVN